MSDKAIKKALKNLKAENISVDSFGRVVLENSEAIENALTKPSTLAANYGCTTNGALCKKAALADIMKDLGK